MVISLDLEKLSGLYTSLGAHIRHTALVVLLCSVCTWLQLMSIFLFLYCLGRSRKPSQITTTVHAIVCDSAVSRTSSAEDPQVMCVGA